MTDWDIADSPAIEEKTREYLALSQNALMANVDRLLACLLAVEWCGAIATAMYFSRIGSRPQNNVHPQVWTAVLAGPAIVFAPVLLAWLCPSSTLTRHVIAVCQMLMSVLVIDVSGGRIESHFQVFGSLAFLAFYRDWRVLVTASVVTAIDHVAGGIWWPQAMYGVSTVSPWRFAEHAWWVAFEDFFLIWSCKRGIAEMWQISRREARLSFGAFYDALTGLPNRRLLQINFARCFGGHGSRIKGSRGAVLFLDLDRFKQVNDTLGHSVGDKLLIQVGQRISTVLPAGDTLARIGGDEFIVVVETTEDSEQAEKIGDRLLAAFNQPFHVGGNEMLLSASVGIALYPEHGADLPCLQEAADHAMYEAKARGRNRWAVFCPKVLQRERSIEILTKDLYQALSLGQIAVNYQPQVGNDEQVLGFEALMRWTHPLYGTIGPGEFIPLAEETGLIVSLGEWVLREACKACKRWHASGFGQLRVSVNVSSVQFEMPGFPDFVAAIVSETGLNPSFLILELTESVLLQDIRQGSEHMVRLRESGVRIALDDFGTGYSSLSYLQAMPADIVKLDHAFVSREFGEMPSVLGSVIEMAHRIGLQVVAEGVETREQSQLLRSMNCDELQGFFYSKALPGRAVLPYLRLQALKTDAAAGELAPTHSASASDDIVFSQVLTTLASAYKEVLPPAALHK